jgi:predicted DCC family thiol-disulfide oxidoreductase YuxK
MSVDPAAFVEASPPGLMVLFDGGCPICRGTVRRLRALDWLHRLRFADATNAAVRERVAPGLTEADVFIEMYVVEPSGRRHGGYDGFLRLARVIPLLWPLAVVGALPGIRQLGRKIYRIIAANRIRRGRCTDDFCEP